MSELVASYLERAPIAPLAPFVSVHWQQHVPEDAEPHVQRSIPTGGAELVWRTGATPVLAGPRTRPTVELLAPGTTVVGWRLRPGATDALLGVPGVELLDDVVDLDLVLGATGRRLADRFAAATDEVEMQERLAVAVFEQPRTDPVIEHVVRRLGPWSATAIGLLERELFLSERHLRRRCTMATGLGPKALQRVLRFQGFVALVQAAIAQGHSPTDWRMARLAAEVGYADQAHLARECRRLTGRSPIEYVANVECGCANHDHAAAFVPVLRTRAPG